MNADIQHDKPSKVLKLHDSLWFHDGNVVLATDTLLFKVHKTLLSLHSSVFRDMFELPSANGMISGQSGVVGASKNTYEGLPLVRLVGDDGEDVAHILRAIYNRRYYDHHDDNTPLRVITALLTLSTKYDFKCIRRDVVVHVSKHYPIELQSYDSVNNNDSSLFGTSREDCHTSLLMAAFTTGIDCLLPTLFFAASDDDFQRIWVMDKTRGLSSECLQVMIKVRFSLEFEFSSFVADLPDGLLRASNHSECPGTVPCHKTARYHSLANLINVPFEETKGPLIVRKYLSPVCASCRLFVANQIEKTRKDIWDKVPLCFGLPAWDILQTNLKEITESREEVLHQSFLTNGSVRAFDASFRGDD